MKKIVLISLMIAVTSCVYAAESKDEGIPTDIKVQVGKVTEVSFPDRVVKVVKGGNQESILVEVLDNSVYLLPKSQEPSDVFVTTLAGSSYPLTLHDSENRDVKIQVGNFKRNKQFNANQAYPDLMDLMKDLLLDKEPAGATVLPVKGEVFLSGEQMKVIVKKAYELIGYKALVLEAKNLTNNALIIPLEQIDMPDLLAISSDRDMITAKGYAGDTALVYVITGSKDEYNVI